MNTLFEINRDLEALMAKAVDPETGEINEAVFAEVEALSISREEKIRNWALWLKSQAAYAESIKAEKLAMAKRQQQAENLYKRSSEYLQALLAGEKIKTAEFEISYRKSQACNIDNCTVDALERAHLTGLIKYSAELRKDEIKKALKEGYEVPGAYLEERISMSIK